MEKSKSNLKTLLNDLVECSVCQDLFDDPRSLPCLHTFCLQCIRGVYNNSSASTSSRVLPPSNRGHVSCPQCRQTFALPAGGVDALPHDFKVSSLMQKMSDDDYCSGHPDDLVTAKKFCIKCVEYACSVCELTRHYDCAGQCVTPDEAARQLGAGFDAVADRVATLCASFRGEAHRLEAVARDANSRARGVEKDIRKAGERLKSMVDRSIDELIPQLLRTVHDSDVDAEKSRCEEACEEMEDFRVETRNRDRGRLHERAEALKDVAATADALTTKYHRGPEVGLQAPAFDFAPLRYGDENLVGKLILMRGAVKRKASDSSGENAASAAAQKKHRSSYAARGKSRDRISDEESEWNQWIAE